MDTHVCAEKNRVTLLLENIARRLNFAARFVHNCTNLLALGRS